jgi:hypothetical protein
VKVISVNGALDNDGTPRKEGARGEGEAQENRGRARRRSEATHDMLELKKEQGAASQHGAREARYGGDGERTI